MNLKDLRTKVTAFFASGRPPTVEQGQRSAEQARDKRASAVNDLRTEVRRLQQEISDASDAAEREGGRGANADSDPRIVALHQRLEQKQAELARFQARV